MSGERATHATTSAGALGQFAGHVGLDEARHDKVHPDAPGAELDVHHPLGRGQQRHTVAAGHCRRPAGAGDQAVVFMQSCRAGGQTGSLSWKYGITSSAKSFIEARTFLSSRPPIRIQQKISCCPISL